MGFRHLALVNLVTIKGQNKCSSSWINDPILSVAEVDYPESFGQLSDY